MAKRPPPAPDALTRLELRQLDEVVLQDKLAAAVDNLSDKQRKYMDGLLRGETKAAAAVAAGYSSGHKSANVTVIARNPRFAYALSLSHEWASRGSQTTIEWIRTQHAKNIKDARAVGDLKVVNQSLKELAKLDDHYAPERVHHTGSPWADIIDEMPSTLAPPQHRGSETDADTRH